MARKYDIRNSNTDQASANSVHRQIGSISPERFTGRRARLRLGRIRSRLWTRRLYRVRECGPAAASKLAVLHRLLLATVQRDWP